MRYLKNFSILILIVSILSGCNNKDSNSSLIYGESGLPKNCRAIITSNINGYKNKSYTADEALNSIERNCGEFGYSWGKTNDN